MRLPVAPAEPVAGGPVSEERAAAALEALVAKHCLTIEERDFTQLVGNIGDRVMALHDSRDDRTIAVAVNQDPSLRLRAVCRILEEMGVKQ
ncbi:hypothetical protein [Streptomyces sp. NPDC005374]|uniref:hypothetical protein n=1 Tax=Streptomyces sp. NPDC005374 TaxID=3364713 RepID=UPI00368659BA